MTKTFCAYSTVLLAFISSCGRADDRDPGDVHCDPPGQVPVTFAAGEGCVIKSLWVQPPCYVTECESVDGGGEQLSCNLAQVKVHPPMTAPESGSATLDCGVTVEAGFHMYHTVAHFEAQPHACAVSDGLSWYWAPTAEDPRVVACNHGDASVMDGAQE